MFSYFRTLSSLKNENKRLKLENSELKARVNSSFEVKQLLIEGRDKYADENEKLRDELTSYKEETTGKLIYYQTKLNQALDRLLEKDGIPPYSPTPKKKVGRPKKVKK